ncbi:SMI1/KNR4 family protein [Guptibacillus sedimenti]|uniref:SMI1/KNR4 family protein n=1 Tax=Guptibacillus sedimenti TaxID=3025680 RepID=UPI0023616AD2|nr:SMI1/KNR4 family protein [Pseudalkalibacillus sedimenti]
MNEELEWEYADTVVSETKVKEVGLQLGFQLPHDYIECVKQFGGASVFPEEFNVEGVERCFGSLFSFDENSSEHIIKNYNIYKTSIPKNVLPIADDPAGNLICLDYKDSTHTPKVVFWEHENAADKEMLMKEENLTEIQVEERVRENIFFISDTFSGFLNKLHD